DTTLQAGFTFRSEGSESQISIQSVTLAEAADWVVDPAILMRLPVRSEPLYLSNADSFWFRYLEASRTLYVQYNNVVATGSNGERLTQFVTRLQDALANNAVDRIVVDLRHNNGGNRNTYAPLVNLLEQRSASLYIITGRRTFSAAQNFATELDL